MGLSPTAAGRALRRAVGGRVRRRRGRRHDHAACGCSRPASPRPSTCRPTTWTSTTLDARRHPHVVRVEGRGRVLHACRSGGARCLDAAWTYRHAPTRTSSPHRPRGLLPPAGRTPASSAASGSRRATAAFYGGWITSRVVGPFKGAARHPALVSDALRIRALSVFEGVVYHCWPVDLLIPAGRCSRSRRCCATATPMPRADRCCSRWPTTSPWWAGSTRPDPACASSQRPGRHRRPPRRRAHQLPDLDPRPAIRAQRLVEVARAQPFEVEGHVAVAGVPHGGHHLGRAGPARASRSATGTSMRARSP